MIQVGDLVQVVRPTSCCGSDVSIGKIFIVAEFSDRLGKCKICGYIDDKIFARSGETLTNGKHQAYQVDRLKRIPPLSELEARNERLEEHV